VATTREKSSKRRREGEELVMGIVTGTRKKVSRGRSLSRLYKADEVGKDKGDETGGGTTLSWPTCSLTEKEKNKKDGV